METPFKEAEFDIIYGEGISKEGNILDVAVELDIIKKSGAWFSYDGMKIGQGRDNARKYLKDNPEFCSMIEEMVRNSMSETPEDNLGKNNENTEVLENHFVNSDENTIF